MSKGIIALLGSIAFLLGSLVALIGYHNNPHSGVAVGGASGFDVVNANSLVASTTGQGYVSLGLGAGVTQNDWCNTVKDSFGNSTTTIIDYLEAQLASTSPTGTNLSSVASGTMRLIVGTSTLSSMNDFLNPGGFGSLTSTTSLLVMNIATSSASASTTNSLGKNNGQAGAVAVPPNSCVIAAILQGADNLTPSNCAALATCPTASSSDRGFNATVRFHYHFPYYNQLNGGVGY